MSRQKKNKNKINIIEMERGKLIEKNEMVDKIIDNNEIQQKKEEKGDPEPEFISIFEAANRLKTIEATIKMWVDHGHLIAQNGRILTKSIIECKFNRGE